MWPERERANLFIIAIIAIFARAVHYMRHAMSALLVLGCLTFSSGCGRQAYGYFLCGDGECFGETCDSCPEDCGPCACGDGECGEGETCESCPKDCGECVLCGDDICAGGEENCQTCPEDCGECPPGCGDGICRANENCLTCPLDCGECPPGCGDGVCDEGEDCYSCPPDCGLCPSYCDDGYCDHDESCATCPEDCGECPPGCGDGTCDPLGGETCVNCPQDCACGTATCQEILTCAYGCEGNDDCLNACVMRGCYEAQAQVLELFLCLREACPTQCQVMGSQECLSCGAMACGGLALACYNGTCGPQNCGDGVCQPEESCVNCPEDCGACPDQCGDGVCQLTETCETCEADCGPCFWCGDGYCAPDEDCDSCPEDCGACPILCGDGVCMQLLGENCANCPQDCECGGDTCSQILSCMYGCQDIMCPNTCLSGGCYEAQQQAHAVLQCLLTNCLMSCFNPSDPACQQCLMDSCGGQLIACMVGTCS